MTPIIQHFDPTTVPAAAQPMATGIAELAQQLSEVLPEDPETTMGLRKMLEARDCFVRAYAVRDRKLFEEQQQAEVPA